MNRSPRLLAICLAALGVAGLLSTQQLLHGDSRSGAVSLKEPGSYRDIVRGILPAVVSVETTRKHAVAMSGFQQGSPFGEFPGLPDELRKRFEHLRPHEPAPDPRPGRGIGSGFVVDPKGTIVTNDHVVRGADKVEVRLADGRKFLSREIKRDPKTDLAVIKIDAPESLPYLEFADSNTIEIGDRVLAVGAPFGMTGSVTSGIISAKGRDLHMNMYEDFLQTDAAINPGNSGGPLVNLEGKVVGVNSAIKSETGGFQGVGLAISSNLARTVMQQLLKDGTIHRGYLGVQVQALEPEVAERLGIANRTGILISKVTDGTPAAKAGLKDGDVLIAVADKPVKDARGLQQTVAGLPLGKPIELTIVRDGAKQTLSVTIEEQPKSFAVAQGETDGSHSDEGSMASIGKLGIKITDLTPERAKELSLPEKTQGALIAEVDPSGVAAEAGLRGGVVIQKVDKTPVQNADQARKALEQGSLEKGILLQVKNPQGGTSYVMLKAPPAKG
jgi:serine protease Do